MSRFFPIMGLSVHHGAAQLPKVTLTELLKSARTTLPLSAIDGAMGRTGRAALSDIAATRRTHIDAARALLSRIRASTPPEQKALEFYTERLAHASHKAPQKRIHKYVLEQLCMGEAVHPKIQRIYQQLSLEARNALFILLVDAAVPAKHLKEFLLSPELRQVNGGIERILKLVSLLYHYGVEYYGAAFIPSNRDRKLLDSIDRVVGLLIEFEQALWLAANTDAVRVVLDKRVDYNWRDMTSSQHQLLNTRVLANVDPEYRDYLFRSRHLQVDAIVQRPSGIRLVEIKCCNGIHPQYRDEKEAKNIAQILRYGLAVQHHQLEGIEYIMMIRNTDRRLLRNIKRALSATGVPYVLRLINGKEKISSKGIDLPIIERPLASSRTRALPSIPTTPPAQSGTRNARPTPAQQPFKTQEEVRAYLAGLLGHRNVS